MGVLLLGGLIFFVIKFWDKLKPLLLKLITLAKKIDWSALYEKAQKSGALDKAVDLVNSRKKK